MAGRILGASELDGVTLSVTSAAGDYVIANLTDIQPGLKWRSTNTSAQTITGDMGGSKAITAFVLYNHNLSSGGTIQFTLSTDSGHTAQAYDATVNAQEPTYGWGDGPYGGLGNDNTYGGFSTEGWVTKFTVIWLGATYVGRYIRVILTDASNSDGYIEAGRIKVGQHVEFPYRNGYDMGWQEQTELIRTRGGALRSDSRTPYRYANIPTSYLTAAQEGDLLEVFRSVGRDGDVFWSAFPSAGTTQEQRNTILGRMTDYSSAAIDYVGSELSFSIEESL